MQAQKNEKLNVCVLKTLLWNCQNEWDGIIEKVAAKTTAENEPSQKQKQSRLI